MKIAKSRLAVAGEKFTWRQDPMIVKPKGTGSDGRWACISCDYSCAHNMDRDFHCQGARKLKTEGQPGGKDAPGERARHVLAWLSLDSGEFEAP